MYNRQNERGAVYFYVKLNEKGAVTFQNTELAQLYNSKSERGFVRKAIAKSLQEVPQGQRFVDKEFKVIPQGNTRVVRLFDLIKSQGFLFPTNEVDSSYIHPQQHYNSFLAESGIISYGYARTLFMTQFVNEEGYYRYFIKRNGEYYVEQCDDYILVDRNTLKPIWGLDLAHPWQIMLFKAWLKECQSLSNMYEQQPFTFLQAFGLPQYRLFNFRKQLKFLVEEKIPDGDKKDKLSNFSMYGKDFIFIARTVTSTAVSKVGLIPNTAAYRISMEDQTSKSRLFKLYSSLPCHWVGSHSPVYQTPLNHVLRSQMSLDLERSFLLTQKQVMTYFNKFYAAPAIASIPKNLVLQDCMNVESKIGKPIWINIRVLDPSGLLAICIQLPKKRDPVTKIYPQFRYFLAKKLENEQQMSRSHFREDIANSRLEDNMYISSDCDKWRYYRIDYVQGYENHAGFFSKVQKGQYVLFIQAQMNGNIRVRFDSHVRMEEPYQYQPPVEEIKQIFDSTFFSISAVSAVEATFNQNSFDQSIALNNSFEELGFGSICIKTLAKAKHKVAMRVNPEKLREGGLQLLSHYDKLQDFGKQKNFVLVSEKGKPKIIVLERIANRSKTEINEVFPPVGSVQFFKVMPNRSLYNQSQSVLMPAK